MPAPFGLERPERLFDATGLPITDGPGPQPHKISEADPGDFDVRQNWPAGQIAPAARPPFDFDLGDGAVQIIARGLRPIDYVDDQFAIPDDQGASYRLFGDQLYDEGQSWPYAHIYEETEHGA